MSKKTVTPAGKRRDNKGKKKNMKHKVKPGYHMKAVKCRIYPTSKQIAYFETTIDCKNAWWNMIVEMNQKTLQTWS